MSKSDLLVDETVDEILGQFDVEHAFPNTFRPSEKKDGWFKRLWSKARAWFRPRVVADVHCEQDAVPTGGQVVEAGAGAGQGIAASPAELRVTAKS